MRVLEDVYTCASCGAEAGSLRLLIDEPAEKATLDVFGLVGRATSWPSRAHAETIARAIERGSARDLHNLADEYTPFYCVECDACYCRAHWHIEAMHDTDLQNWYDASYGTCPRGHRRMVAD